MAELPTRDEFTNCRGDRFQIALESGGPLEVELIEVKALRGPPAPAGRPFSVLFVGPASPVLSQQLYSFTHERLGAFTIFIVPVRRDAQGIQYEAVFN